MPDDPRPEMSPESAPPAPHAGIGKRRFLIKAALIGSAMPAVITLSRSAIAHNSTNSTGGKCKSTYHTQGTIPSQSNACIAN